MPKRTPPPPDLLTITEACEALRCSRMTYYRLVDAGDLNPVRVRRAVRIRRADVDAFLAAGGTGGRRRRRRS